jgi:hypothetical protein
MSLCSDIVLHTRVQYSLELSLCVARVFRSNTAFLAHHDHKPTSHGPT